MAASVVELFPVTPPKEQLPPLGVFTRILIERAATQAGAYAQIADIAISLGDEYTYYADQNGDDTFWYKYRYSNGAASFSGYTDPIQAGDSIIRQSVRSEIPDLDISASLWDRWGREVLIDLYIAGIWKPDEGEVVITSLTGVADEGYALPSYIREVIALEQRDQYGRLVRVLDAGADPEDFDYMLGPTNRRIRIFAPSTATTDHYWVVGKAQYQTLGELTNDYYTVAIHMLLVKYAMFRQHQRLNWKKFITFDPTTDILPRDLAAFIAQEKAEVASRVAALALPEPAIPLPY